MVFLLLFTALFLISAVACQFGDDVLSDPRFKISISTEKIPNTDMYTTGPNKIIMRSSFGQPFLCTIPDVEQETEKQEKTREVKEKTIQDTESMIERGLQLLEPLSKSCIQFYANSHQYWIYEYCHKQYVRQFHIDRIYDGKEEKEQETASFYLGVYPSFAIDPANNKAILQTTSQSSVKPTTFIKEVDNQYYLVQKWEDGTLCDLTDRPRTVEIQYQCDAQGYDRVSSFLETATCQYQAIISTPRLCDEMGLSRHHQSEAHRITCNPIVSSEEFYQEERLVEEERLMLDQMEDKTHATVESVPTSDLNVPEENTLAVKKEDHVYTEMREADVLLGMITQLTEQINQIKLQLKNSQKEDQKPKSDLSFFMLDDDGNIVSTGNELNRLLGLTIQQQQLKEQQKKKQAEEAINRYREQAKEQHENRQAYQQQYVV
ncbi:hypothetical protein BDB01DRAFT_908572 [Pilobolus umbonatus]|nr:hypothetical protein BDB01DRAFT_908572 [Pilobolus umbonatus]